MDNKGLGYGVVVEVAGVHEAECLTVELSVGETSSAGTIEGDAAGSIMTQELLWLGDVTDFGRRGIGF